MANEFKKRTKYDGKITPASLLEHPSSSLSIIARAPGDNLKVLDIGCATGFLGEYLQTRHCTVWGIDSNAEAIFEAKKHLFRAFTLDIENQKLSDVLEQNKFDVIILAAVLEHVRNPKEILMECGEHLSESGILIMSVPNIANYKTRLKLLIGDFTYTEYGILDKTHVHLYTKKTARELIKDAKYVILNETVSVPLPGARFLAKIPFLNKLPGFLGKLFPSLFGEELIFTLKPANG